MLRRCELLDLPQVRIGQDYQGLSLVDGECEQPLGGRDRVNGLGGVAQSGTDLTYIGLESGALEPPSHQIVSGATFCEHLGAALAGALRRSRQRGVPGSGDLTWLTPSFSTNNSPRCFSFAR
jgi:hypothetical protein